MKKTDSEDSKQDQLVEAPEEKESSEDQVAKLEAKVADLEAQVADWKDKLLRAHADLDNTRKRLIKDKDDAIKFANSELIAELLVPMDNLERAIASCSSANDVKAISDGVSMVAQQFSDVLKHNGLEVIDSKPGTEFNPDEHEACMMEMNPDAKVETVQIELVKGYKLHGRVIRPAKVKVSKPEV
ncbi:MAG: nucleotide exchange factor GrpE [Sphaerochaetaceae bacterium]|nr:nucleotide exchange factor GrpE [Sphaerochaetaceae bacterium]MDD3164175.1 nucleotide exchange factor GrpE [Sphaerochaetaceae bacterium]MDD4006467.1 nucleotide exchange factor GrpE [Sphaerochaetaceae bacterium]MDD4397165.1 nucleotide exchange factor GrpE [Sphaerochaetaceae bacterium]